MNFHKIITAAIYAAVIES